nr:hypothetical protein GCM10020063_042810 [Dactylosporangium thailandense]
MVVGCAKQKFWDRLTALLGDGELTKPRFADFPARLANREFPARLATREALVKVLGIPCAPVNDLTAALAEPHLADRGMIVETEHEQFGRVRSIASPVRVGDRRVRPRAAGAFGPGGVRPPPRLGKLMRGVKPPRAGDDRL